MTPSPIPPVIDGPKRISVRYSLTRGDIFRWQIHLAVRNRLLFAFGLPLLLLLVWSDFRNPELAGHPMGYKIIAGVLFICLILGAFSLLMALMIGCLVLFKKYRGLLGEHELEVRDEGLIERTDVNESLHRWIGFQKIVSTGRYLYIYVTDNNVHIVPRRCFGSVQEERAFRVSLEGHINAA
jgi:hypothetical protein